MAKQVLGALLVGAAAANGPLPRLPVPEFEVSLDVVPEQRFTKVIQHFNSSIWNFYTEYHLKNFLVGDLAKKVAKNRGPEADEFMRELQGVAQLTNIPVEDLHTIQMLYEINTLMVPIVNITWPWDKEDKGMYAIEAKNVSTPDPTTLRFGCTGIIATDANDGSVYHARNLDFSFAKYLQPLTYTAIFTKSGEEVFRAQMIAGYSAIITGMRKGSNGYTIEINTRFGGHGGYKEMLHNMFTERRPLSGWSKRKIMEEHDNFEDAVQAFSHTPYIATEYNIVAGVKKGVIIGRDPDGPAYTIPLNDKKYGHDDKYIIVTNFDYIYHDIREKFDPTGGKGIFHPRRQAAEKILDAAKVVTPELLFSTINDYEVMAKDTIFQAIMNVEKGLWNVSLPACTSCDQTVVQASIIV